MNVGNVFFCCVYWNEIMRSTVKVRSCMSRSSSTSIASMLEIKERDRQRERETTNNCWTSSIPEMCKLV